jgi:RNase P/RNase MRP subunit p29
MKHEISLIGSVIEIIGSNNKDSEKIKGKVVDETKSTIIVSDSNDSDKKKRILKNTVTIKTQDGKIINGKDVEDDIVSRLRQKNKEAKKNKKENKRKH